MIDCPLADEESMEGHRCINCINKEYSHKHRADDPNCGARIEYWNRIQSQITKRNETKGPAASKPAPRNTINYPPLKKSVSPTFTQAQFHQSYSSVANTPSQSPNRKAMGSASAQTNTDLLPIDVIESILLESIDKLEACRTAFDQMRVLTGMITRCLRR